MGKDCAELEVHSLAVGGIIELETEWSLRLPHLAGERLSGARDLVGLVHDSESAGFETHWAIEAQPY